MRHKPSSQHLVRPRPSGDPIAWRRRLEEWLRAEFVAGAEAEWRKRTGRLMTAEELERVLAPVSRGRVAG